MYLPNVVEDYLSRAQVRLETATNPRSPWDTFGNNSTGGSATPSDKNSSGVYVGQAFLNWHPEDWYEMTVGRMPMPLYTTPMVWDSDINPEGRTNGTRAPRCWPSAR